MLHLRELGLLDLGAFTATGALLGENLYEWERSERRKRFRELLQKLDSIDPDDVILVPPRAKERGLTGTLVFPIGNLAPQGSVIKATAIDPSVVGADGVYRHEGPARVFTSEAAAIAAVREGRIVAGDTIVLCGVGPMGTGMEETYQITSALKALPFGKHVALLTDARFSGVSTGACIGHIGPEALAGGPLGRVYDGDLIQVIVDRRQMTGSVDLVGADGRRFTAAKGERVLRKRKPHAGLAAHAKLPGDTRLWAALQNASGGTWGGCVYDAGAILERLGK
jgi:dihydroxyacid dehydratase/phosphogluconate dehydratase